MSKTYRMTCGKEMPAALQWLEKELGDSRPHYPMICEELLAYLLRNGDREIRLSVRGKWNRTVEIRTGGEPEDFSESLSPADDDKTRITNEIRMNLLNQYASFYDFQYRKGENIFRIFPDAPASEDLCDELYSFYEQSTDKDRQKPISPLLFLFRKHPVRFVFAMIVKAVKHLGALMLPVFAANIIDTVVREGAFFIWPVWLNIIGSVTALAVNLICFRIDNDLYHRWTRSVESAFKLTLVRKVQALSIRFHSTVPSGKLLSKLISDVQFIELLIYERLTDVLHLCVDIIFVCVVALIRFPLMLLFYVVIVPAAVLFIRQAADPVMKSKTVMRKQAEISNAAFKEMLDMDQLTRSQGMQRAELRRITSRVHRVQAAAEQYDRLGVWVNNITYGGSQGFRLICLCFAAYLAASGHISVGTVVLFQSVFEMIISSVQRVLDTLPEIVQGYDSLISVNEILFDPNVEKTGSRQLPQPVRGEIELRNVTFAYEPDQAPVLKGISLRIPAGSSAAFIGKSGAGKSTLMNLILGMYSPQSGKILIDGEDLADLDRNSYRRQIAVVPQNTVLFSGTLWENLVYGLSYVSTEQVMDVLHRVGLDDLLRILPDGLNSQVLENGRNLSGGQRQRIAIARALLRNARIILFDEATSALDAESEKQVQAAINEAMKQATVIMVAHRLNTLRMVDRIYRIDNGESAACESFEQLIRETEGVTTSAHDQTSPGSPPASEP